MSVFSSDVHADWKVITLAGIHRLYNILNEVWYFFNICSFCINCICPFSRNLNFYSAVNTSIYCSIVHVNDSFTLLTVGFVDSFLHVFNSIIDWDDISQFEECSLQYGVCTVTKTDFSCNLCSVNCVEFNMFLSQSSLNVCWQLFI